MIIIIYFFYNNNNNNNNNSNNDSNNNNNNNKWLFMCDTKLWYNKLKLQTQKITRKNKTRRLKYNNVKKYSLQYLQGWL